MPLKLESLKKTWKNEYIQTVLMGVAIILVVFGVWYGTKLLLNTQYPALAVASGSMCKLPGSRCDGWSHPFKETLHVGDLIVVQGISPEEIEASPYPTGDIIVFRDPSDGSGLIVHRTISKENRSGDWYFQTRGDGNSGPDSVRVPEDQVIGKVILRIPWIGHIALSMRTPIGIYVIAILIMVLISVELVFSSKKRNSNGEDNSHAGFSWTDP